MSVAATTAESTQAANGVKTDFDFSFKIFLATDLLVYVETAVGSGNYALQTYAVDYTVSFNTVAETGTAIFTVAPATGRNVKLLRSTPQTQPSVLPLEGKMPAKVIEDALDRLTLMVQDLAEISTSPVALNVVEYAQGTFGDKPSSYAEWTMYYSTDVDQLEMYVPAAGRWFLVG